MKIVNKRQNEIGLKLHFERMNGVILILSNPEHICFFGNPKRPINVIKKILPQNFLVLITLKLSHYLRFHFLETLQISFDGLIATVYKGDLYVCYIQNK